MQVIVNGHTYLITPFSSEGFTSNPDYRVQLGTAAATAPFVGTLVWEGNGAESMLYKVVDMYGETVGGGQGYAAALLVIDALCFPHG